MSYDIYFQIKRYHDTKDEQILLNLIEDFTPLIKKYSKKLSYEDSFQDLMLTFITVINKISLNSYKEDKYILSYINTSIKNSFYNLNNKYCTIKNNELIVDSTLPNYGTEVSFDSNFFITYSLDKLTPKEKLIINYLYVNDMKVIDISKKLKISRQAVNKTKNNALRKIKRELI